MSLKIILKKYWLSLLLILLGGLFVYYFGNKISPDEITSFVMKAGIFGPVIYILAMTLTFVIAPLSGSPIFFAGFVLFGKNFQLLIYIAAVIGATVNFWIARIWGRKIVVKMVGEKNMDKVDEFTKDYGITTLIFLRVFQGNLMDFISYAFGLTKIKFLPYLLVTLLSPLPYLLFWQLYVIPRVQNLRDLAVWQFGILIPILAISGFLYVKFKKKNQKLKTP